MDDRRMAASARFPFDLEFQKSLIKLLLGDPIFANAISPWLREDYFESAPLRWAYSQCQAYRHAYGTMPSLHVLQNEVRKIQPQAQLLYYETLKSVEEQSLADDQWLRDSTIEFVKRNVFVQAFTEARGLYNAGQTDAAYDTMARRLEELQGIQWQLVDRGWVADEWGQRQLARESQDLDEDSLPTGLPGVDRVLDGGLDPGEVGVWIAYPKGGKSTILVNIGRKAVQSYARRVLHMVFEGSRKLVETRYDACVANELYTKVKRGDITAEKHAEIHRLYSEARGRLVVRAFTEDWDYTILNVHNELKELQAYFGWKPDLVIVDYGDLLNARFKVTSETEKQRAGFRDLVSLSKRGYRVWTATQAQRPKDESFEVTPHLLKSKHIADCFDKVRSCAFIGSLNQTLQEKEQKVMRLYNEMYRENEAGSVYVARADMGRMLITHEDGLVSPHGVTTPGGQGGIPFGYVQTRVPV